MSEYVLTELQYSTDTVGPFALYIYDVLGYHSGKQWFAKRVRYPNECVTIEIARQRVEEAVAKGLEIRICDAGDMLVFHSVGGKQVYPGADFWGRIGGY